MIASASADTVHQPWWANARPDLAPAFRRARRHSRIVRVLRYALPGGLVAAVGLYLVVGWLASLALPGVPSISNLVISGTRITMDAPKLGGYTRDGRPYELTATAAAQDLKKPQFIELKEIRAQVELRDGNVVIVTGDAGIYDTKGEQVSMRDNIVVATTNGMQVRLREATIDIKKGHIVSREKVEVTTSSGRIDANAMEIAEQGAVIQFGGGVRMEIRADDASQRRGSSERTP
jgi:lipopolysaccharide export system protein LptC